MRELSFLTLLQFPFSLLQSQSGYQQRSRFVDLLVLSTYLLTGMSKGETTFNGASNAVPT
jgi:hypothetical protein